MSLVVQKYGGTSLGNAERLQNVAKIIADTLEQNRVIVVVSAMSSYIKPNEPPAGFLKQEIRAEERRVG